MTNFSSFPLRRLLLPGLLLLGTLAARAQGVGIGTTAPDASAALDIVSSSKGVLLPRVASTGSVANPATGLIVFQTTSPAGYYYNTGTTAAPVWQQLATTANVIQNTTTQQASSNYNISGNGTVGGTLTAANASVTTALTGTGANLGTVVGVGIRADGGLNLGQNTTGNSLYLGYQAGRVSTGSSNQFIGYQSGYSNTTGANNLFLGIGSGAANTSGNSNIFSGSYAGGNTTTGSSNIFTGFATGYNNSTGSNNVFVGQQAGNGNSTGSSNIFIGYQAAYSSTTGNDNVFAGYQSGYNNRGSNNIFSGTYSGLGNTTGNNNLALGYNAGANLTTGSVNTVLGYGSGPASGSGAISNATALGANVSLTQSNTVILGSGASVGIGTSTPTQKLDVTGGSIKISTSGNGLIFPDGTTQTTANLTGDITSTGAATTYAGIVPATKGGAGAVSGLLKANGSGTVSQAVAGTDYAAATGSTAYVQNTTTQQATSNFNISGSGTVGGTLTAANASVTTALTGSGADLGGAVGVGIRADGGLNLGQNNGSNIYLGYQAGPVNTGVQNQFIGSQAGLVNTTGARNVFIGAASGLQNVSGIDNVFTGVASGYSTTGSYNVFNGTESGAGTNAGANNTFLGWRSGFNNNTGNNNTALGYGSGPANGSGNLSNATAVGANVSLTTSNTLILGSGANVGIGTAAPSAALEVQAGSAVSTSTTGTSTQLRLSRVGTTNNKWPSVAELALGTYGTDISSQSQLDFKLAQNGNANADQTILTLRGDGRVGIGTATPAQKLDVTGGSISISTTGQGLIFPDGSTQTTAATTTAATTASNGLTKTGNNIALGGTLTGATTIANGGNAFAITGTGNVGIGTSSPATRLQVVSADNASATNILDAQALNLTAGSALWYGGLRGTGTNANNPLYLDAKGTGSILLNAAGGTGNVGIGTSSPATRLDVNGNLRLAVRLCPANTSASYTLTAADVAFSIFKMQNGSFVNPLVLPDATAGQVEGQELSVLNLATNGTSVSGTNTDNATAVALPAAGAAGSHAVKYVWAVAASGSGYWVRVQ